ncbi:MAG: hypothetical protein PHI28_11855 [Mangrovibacterium sp.]|nr:hypothetical protein [Mangrovibacterium sp.]
MKLNFYFLSIFLLFAINGYCSDHSAIAFQVIRAGELPSAGGKANPGVAGAFSGVTEEKLIIAGGANFPEQKPWEGGLKTFHDRIYIYQMQQDSLLLIDDSQKLPYPVAYGASVSLPAGVLCIGGNNRESCFSDVFLLKWNDQSRQVIPEEFPGLPLPLTCASAVILGDVVYVVGGSSSADGMDTENHFFRLDLSKKGTSGFGWTSEPPFP